MTVAIGLIAKAPVAGAVKTRLCPPLTPAEAAELAGELLLDLVASALRTGHAVWCVHAGPAAPLRALLPADLPLLAQRGADLAERLAAAQADLHAMGHDRVLLVGADCPTVDTALLLRAVAALDEADVVLGPATDGGYTLIASREPQPAAFADVIMSTPHVLRDTLDRCHVAGLRTVAVDERHDLDTIGDLRAALGAGQLAEAPRTAAAARRFVAAGHGEGHGPDRPPQP